MTGKTPGDSASLSFDEAEEAAAALRPSWAADDDAFEAPPAAATIVNGSAGANPMALKPAVATQLGISPEAAAIVAAANAANNAPVAAPAAAPAPAPPAVGAAASAQATRLGGISPEAAAIVAAANAAAARAPAPSSEALDSANVLEVAPAVPQPTATAPMPEAPISSSPAASRSAPPPAHVVPAPIVKPKAAPIPFTAHDPFKNTTPDDDDDLDFPKKKSRAPIFAVLAILVLAGGGAFYKFGMSTEETPRPAPSADLGPSTPAPTADIPEPPPKDEVAPATTTKTADTAKTADPPAAKADPPPAKTAEPPKAAAATPAPKPKAPPPPPPPPATPKTAPKATGGGIVRDSPF